MNKLHLKVGIFAFTALALGAAFLIYLLHARGFFDSPFQLQLAASTADGVAPGVPIAFSGIEIGQVAALGLNDGGGIIIRAEIPARYAKWLKADSTFTLDKPIVGGAKIRVDSPHLDAPALPDNSTMLLVTSDVSKEIPVLVERVKAILANVEHLTRRDGEINATLANAQTITGRMTGKYGVLEGVLGSPEKARAVTDSLEKTRVLITRLDGIALKVDGMSAKTDEWLFAKNGVAEHTRESLAQVRLMLNDAQSSLKKADMVMKNAVDISANVRDGTQDLGKLRTEIDDAVRKTNSLVNELNKKWPFARESGVKLP